MGNLGLRETDESFLPLRRVVIRGNGEEPQVLTLAMRCSPAGTADPQRIDGIHSSRWLDAGDCLPLDPRVAIELVPGEVADLVEGVKGRMALRLLQR